MYMCVHTKVYAYVCVYKDNKTKRKKEKWKPRWLWLLGSLGWPARQWAWQLKVRRARWWRVCSPPVTSSYILCHIIIHTMSHHIWAWRLRVRRARWWRVCSPPVTSSYILCHIIIHTMSHHMIIHLIYMCMRMRMCMCVYMCMCMCMYMHVHMYVYVYV